MSEGEITTWAVFLSILTAMVVLEFLAIGRHPAYRKRELFRRVVGILTVLGLSGATIHHTGGDWYTWGMITVFFGAAGGAAWVAQRWERSRKRRLREPGEGRNGSGNQREKAREIRP
jgi:hypothetical protein